MDSYEISSLNKETKSLNKKIKYTFQFLKNIIFINFINLDLFKIVIVSSTKFLMT